MKIILFIILGVVALAFAVSLIKIFINAQKYKIRSANGVQKKEFITIGGIEQFIQIRGQDKNNPIIIVLHGGPGNNMAYYSYLWQAELENDYTIVHWDQRGCGNTYYHNTKAARPTFDLLLSDLNELVDYISAEYSCKKVIIMGHSWGTLLGSVYAGNHPQKVSAYVGVGQFSDVWQSEEHASKEAIRLAKTANKPEDAKNIADQFKLVSFGEEINMKEFIKLRRLTGKYLPQGNNTKLSVSMYSPYMTRKDLKWFFLMVFNLDKFLGIQHQIYDMVYSKNGLSNYNYTSFEMPVIIIAGSCDWITPFNMAQRYFENISAPKKEFILIEKAGHIPFEPGRFTEELQKSLSNVL